MLSLQLLSFVPAYVLVFFRLLGMLVFAPLLGSQMIPRLVKILLASVLAMAIAPTLSQAVLLPESSWQLSLAIGGELAFGIAIGMVLSFVFTSVQWAGEMIGQQMGLNLSEVFDPQMGAQSTLIATMYYMLATVIFLGPEVRGDQAMLRGVRASFDTLPLLSLGMDQPLLLTLIDFFETATSLAFQLASPILVTMLIVDLAMGFIGRTMPQLNIMSAGLSVRALVGTLVLIIGLSLSSRAISNALNDTLRGANQIWMTPR